MGDRDFGWVSISYTSLHVFRLRCVWCWSMLVFRNPGIWRRLLNHLIMLCKKRPEPSKDYEWIAKTQDMPTKIFGGFLFNDIYPTKNPKILGLHLSSFGPILYPHAQAFEGFVSSHGFSTDTDFELKFGVVRSDEKPTPLSGHGWRLWPGGGCWHLARVGSPSHWGTRVGKWFLSSQASEWNWCFFTRLQCYNVTISLEIESVFDPRGNISEMAFVVT